MSERGRLPLRDRTPLLNSSRMSAADAVIVPCRSLPDDGLKSQMGQRCFYCAVIRSA